MNAALSARCQWLQAREDAIKWRRARTAVPCGDCQSTPDGQHADGRDVDLIAEYEQTACELVQSAAYPLSSDTRVTAPRDLLAERHQPTARAAAEPGALLARCQRRMRGLLDVPGQPAIAAARLLEALGVPPARTDDAAPVERRKCSARQFIAAYRPSELAKLENGDRSKP